MTNQSGEPTAPETVTSTSPDPTEAGERDTTRSDPPGHADSPASTASTEPAVPATKLGTVWVALSVTALAFVLVIVLLLQNTAHVQVSFLWMEGSAPLAVTLLIAAVGSALMTVLLGTLRITQLRRLSRRRDRPRASRV